MELRDFTSQVPGFATMTNPDKAIHIGWFLHTHRGKKSFGTTDIRECYEALHLPLPNISDVLSKLAKKSPPVLLQSGTTFKLAGGARDSLDTKYGDRPITITVHKALAALPGRLTNETQRKYMEEAIRCFRSQCFRAAILMTWNLTYDHLTQWILADPVRLSKFNTKLPNKPPFNVGAGSLISKREDFEHLGEREVVDICEHKSVSIITTNVHKVLCHGLERRHKSAHPNTMEITQINAEDTILDLVVNAVLHLT